MPPDKKLFLLPGRCQWAQLHKPAVFKETINWLFVVRRGERPGVAWCELQITELHAVKKAAGRRAAPGLFMWPVGPAAGREIVN